MAKKDKFASDEATTEEVQSEVVLTEEQIAINTAIDNGTLVELRDAETTSEALKILVTVYLALAGALGDEAGATINALANLKAFQPAKVKAAKVPKEKAFNEVKALKDALANEEPFAELAFLEKDERISEDLKNAIITYTTLANLPLDQAIIDGAKETLANFGRKGKSGTRAASGPKEAFGIEANGVVYRTLISSIRAQGIGKELIQVGDKEHQAEDVAWRKIRVPLLRDGTATFEGVTYTKTDVPEPDAPVEEEAVTE